MGADTQSEGRMISNLDIYRTANVLYEELGEKAVFIAAENAERFLDKGDKEGHATQIMPRGQIQAHNPG